MTIVRVGATKKYTDGWEAAFGKGNKKSKPAKSAKKATAKKGTAKKSVKKSAKKRSTAKAKRK